MEENIIKFAEIKINNLLFSIIIPTYNRALLVEKTIKSVLIQTYKNYEIIVVDNCSTDNTKEILEPYIRENKIHFFQHDKNYERSKSRNTGMLHAKGDYVTFLDSDDLMGENCLIDIYKKLKHTVGVPKLIFNRYAKIDTEGRTIQSYQQRININNPFKHILIGNFLACIGVFISKDIYKRIKFYEEKEIIGSEDWLFWIEVIFDAKKIIRVNNINSFIVEHTGRTVNNFEPKKLELRVEFIKKILKSKLKLKKELNTFEWSSGILIANGYFEAGIKRTSITILFKTFLRFPFIILKIRTIVLIKNLIFK